VVGVDLNHVAALRDLQLDLVQSFTCGTPDGLDDDLITARPGDVHPPGERLEFDGPARRKTQRAIDGFGVSVGLGGGGGGKHESEQTGENGGTCEYHQGPRQTFE
jgi:hypothetical protein